MMCFADTLNRAGAFAWRARTAAMCVAVALMVALTSAGVARADTWPPVLENDLRQFLSTQDAWPTSYTTLLELPPTAPPQSRWDKFSTATCDMVQRKLPTDGPHVVLNFVKSFAETENLVKSVAVTAVKWAVSKNCHGFLAGLRSVL
jgi:hypothetical protein